MVAMMPLTLAKAGEQNSVKKVGGQSETRQFLENLGFVPGSLVTVITQISGNVIVSVRESRVAISREMASKILI
jgi:ferrous iron transport protein A